MIITSFGSSSFANATQTGGSYAFPHTVYDLAFIKYSPLPSPASSGAAGAGRSQLFAKTWGTLFSDRVLDAVLDSVAQVVYGLGVIHLPASTQHFRLTNENTLPGGANDLFVFKLSWENGTLLDYRTFGQAGKDFTNDYQRPSWCSLIFAAETQRLIVTSGADPTTALTDVFVTTFDAPTLNKVSEFQFGDANYDLPKYALYDPNTNRLIVAGVTQSLSMLGQPVLGSHLYPSVIPPIHQGVQSNVKKGFLACFDLLTSKKVWSTASGKFFFSASRLLTVFVDAPVVSSFVSV
jgi:hypothetical protein